MFRRSRYCLMKSGKRFLCSAIFVVFCVFTTRPIDNAAGAEQFQLNVAGLKTNDTLPDRFLYNHAGCAGENISPEISWSGVPATAKSLALVVWDQDAPVSGGFYHWVIVNVPVGTTKLPEGTGDVAGHKVPRGAIQLFNDWGESGYGGPCPPGHSRHRYRFILYALNAQLTVTVRSKVSEATAAIKQSAIASAEQVLVYGR
jgi:Raf kinase inhibitor-like YbhB/YbcL family protein